MLRSYRLIALALIVAALFALAACGSDDDDDDGGGSANTAEEKASACAKDQLETQSPGTLTVGTDKPAFPPYFEDDDPTNGKGFESAVAYAVADELGFAKADVKWTVVPFNSSYAPGPEGLRLRHQPDLDHAARARRSSTSRGRTTSRRRPWWSGRAPTWRACSSLADLKDARSASRSAPRASTRCNSVIKPSKEPEGLQRLQRRRDGAQAEPGGRGRRRPANGLLPHGRPGARARRSSASSARRGGDSFGLLLAKDSTLTPCVDQALDKLDVERRARRDHRQVDGRRRRARRSCADPDRRAVREAARRRRAARGAAISALLHGRRARRASRR